jgi:hypothetical protein
MKECVSAFVAVDKQCGPYESALQTMRVEALTPAAVPLYHTCFEPGSTQADCQHSINAVKTKTLLPLKTRPSSLLGLRQLLFQPATDSNCTCLTVSTGQNHFPVACLQSSDPTRPLTPPFSCLLHPPPIDRRPGDPLSCIGHQSSGSRQPACWIIF